VVATAAPANWQHWQFSIFTRKQSTNGFDEVAMAKPTLQTCWQQRSNDGICTDSDSEQ